MRRIVFMFAVCCESVLHAEDVVAEVTRMYADAQQKIDAAIAAADNVTVETVEGREAKRFLWHSSSGEDLSTLGRAFRIKPPPFRREVINGKEQTVVVSTSCFCYGQFWISFRRGSEVLLTLLIKHGTKIGNFELGGFDVDKAALAPFYDKMTVLAKSTRANKAPESTRGTRP